MKIINDEYGIELCVLFETEKGKPGWQYIHTATIHCEKELKEYAKRLAEKFPNKQYIIHYYKSYETGGIIE